jgi:hypothetical protein
MLHLLILVIGGTIDLHRKPVVGIPVVLVVRLPVDLATCLVLGRGQPMGALHVPHVAEL